MTDQHLRHTDQPAFDGAAIRHAMTARVPGGGRAAPKADTGRRAEAV